MSKLNHTPGPWAAMNGKFIDGKDYLVVAPANTQTGEKGVPVCVICEEIEATATDWDNTRLIVAAPEMLKVLVEVSQYLFRNDRNSIGHKSAYHRKINDLIEKTTGLSIEEVLS